MICCRGCSKIVLEYWMSFLQFVRTSKRYVPEVINYLIGILYLFSEKTERVGKHLLDEFEINTYLTLILTNKMTNQLTKKPVFYLRQVISTFQIPFKTQGYSQD